MRASKLDHMSESVDWSAAARVGVSLVRPGPKLAPAARAAAVQRLRDAAPRAVELVAATSCLPAALQAGSGTTLVVDRAGIVRANVGVMRTVTQALADTAPTLAERLAGRATGVGAGVMMAMVASNILGQYEPFSQRLLLCAPSVEGVRAEIGADPADFALWVCLHEQTHRHQFAAAPWMRDYMLDLMRRVLAEAAGEEDGNSVGTPPKDGNPNLGLLGALSSPTASVVLGEVTALMSLLEGYADMLMDDAGRAAIPTLPAIRAAIDTRRQPRRWSPKAMFGRLIGMAAKIDQYVNGKAFCLSVREQVGIDGLNHAFTSASALPTTDELNDPAAWVARQGLAAEQTWPSAS